MQNRTTVGYLSLLLAACLLLVAPPAPAGSSADAPPQFSPDQVVAFAKRVERDLAASGARVAIVSRLGRPRSELPEGIRYTHVGFAVYSLITTKDGRKLPGYVMYNLYQRADKPNRSDLVQDYPADFFAGVYALDAGIIIPKPELQRRLLKVIGSPTYRALHIPEYSAIANPYNVRLQNCTEFVLDVTTAALYRTSDERQIKADERAYFKATPVAINPLKLALGSMFMEDIALSDQPQQPVTASFTSIAAYMRKYHLAEKIYEIADRNARPMATTKQQKEATGFGQ